ncbi:hypothetical protein PMAYCL1PPCAC_01605, partial [Pristionchus mayeri]
RMLRYCWLFLSLILVVDCYDDSGWSECHEEDKRNYECRSCRDVTVDLTNCPPSGYACDPDQPLRAVVLTPTNERCQSISCANRGWKLAVDGEIVDRVRCTGNQWRTSTGVIADSFVCAKTESTTVKPPVCSGAPLPSNVCKKEPYTANPFSPVCFTGSRQHCEGATVLVGTWIASTGPAYTLDSAECDQSIRKYRVNTLGGEHSFEQISCMKCPYMSGPASTTYTGAHGKATFEKCIVHCDKGELYGKGKGTEEFVVVPSGRAYYSYFVPGAYAFYSKGASSFEPDFYCKLECTGDPIPGPFLCYKDPTLSPPFTSACFTGDGPHCEGFKVLVANSVRIGPPKLFFPLLEGATCEGSDYNTIMIGQTIKVDRVNCMECPHMSGPARTTYSGQHDNAAYDKCSVRCIADGILYGMETTSGNFEQVSHGIAYYTYDPTGSGSFAFADSSLKKFNEDFYCAKTELCGERPVEPFRCIKDPLAGNSAFMKACFTDFGRNCVGNNVLIAQTSLPPRFVYTLESEAFCDQVNEEYTAKLFGQDVKTTQVSCMVCPFMNEEAQTSYDGEDVTVSAKYDKCFVYCDSSLPLYGYDMSAQFVRVAGDRASYSFDPTFNEFFFVDSAGGIFYPDFYCKSPQPACSGEPVGEPYRCNKDPIEGASFTKACFTGDGPNCVGDNVLVARTALKPSFATTLDGDAVCNDDTGLYKSMLFGQNVEASQVSCMACPYMSGVPDMPTPPNPRPGAVPARYDKCIVICDDATLYLEGMGFVDDYYHSVNGNRASYSFNIDSSTHNFLGSTPYLFRPAFQCVPVPVTGLPDARRKRNTSTLQDSKVMRNKPAN